jgi:hypothetical protein
MTAHICEQCDFLGDGNCSVFHGTGNIGEDEMPPGAAILGAALTVDEFQVVNVRGHIDLKADRVNTIRQQTQATAFPVIRDLRVRVFGNTAVMTAIQEPASARRFRFTRLWVNTQSGWKQVINHQTAIQDSIR